MPAATAGSAQLHEIAPRPPPRLPCQPDQWQRQNKRLLERSRGANAKAGGRRPSRPFAIRSSAASNEKITAPRLQVNGVEVIDDVLLPKQQNRHRQDAKIGPTPDQPRPQHEKPAKGGADVGKPPRQFKIIERKGRPEERHVDEVACAGIAQEDRCLDASPGNDRDGGKAKRDRAPATIKQRGHSRDAPPARQCAKPRQRDRPAQSNARTSSSEGTGTAALWTGDSHQKAIR